MGQCTRRDELDLSVSTDLLTFTTQVRSQMKMGLNDVVGYDVETGGACHAG